jgi:hypothetical protein
MTAHQERYTRFAARYHEFAQLMRAYDLGPNRIAKYEVLARACREEAEHEPTARDEACPETRRDGTK